MLSAVVMTGALRVNKKYGDKKAIKVLLYQLRLVFSIFKGKLEISLFKVRNDPIFVTIDKLFFISVHG